MKPFSDQVVVDLLMHVSFLRVNEPLYNLVSLHEPSGGNGTYRFL